MDHNQKKMEKIEGTTELGRIREPIEKTESNADSPEIPDRGDWGVVVGGGGGTGVEIDNLMCYAQSSAKGHISKCTSIFLIHYLNHIPPLHSTVEDLETFREKEVE